MDFSFYRVFIIACVLGVQFFLSTRNNTFWGAVLPIAYFVFLTWMLISNRIDSTISYVLVLLLGLLFLIAEWNGGRKYLRERRKKELEKMKIHDIK